MCPVLSARWIRKRARSVGTRSEDPALQLQVGCGILSYMVANIIKKAAVEANMDPHRCSTH
jgi:hypothetical protein